MEADFIKGNHQRKTVLGDCAEKNLILITTQGYRVYGIKDVRERDFTGLYAG